VYDNGSLVVVSLLIAFPDAISFLWKELAAAAAAAVS
jgi:hypothetical protein